MFLDLNNTGTGLKMGFWFVPAQIPGISPIRATSSMFCGAHEVFIQIITPVPKGQRFIYLITVLDNPSGWLLRSEIWFSVDMSGTKGQKYERLFESDEEAPPHEQVSRVYNYYFLNV